MATLNLGRIKPVFRGAYSGSTAYVVDDIVTHGNESFICIQAHGAGTQATTQTAYWTKLAAKGTDGTDLTSTITTQGDILYRDGSGLQRLAKGTAGQALKMNSGATAPEWAAGSTSNSSQYTNITVNTFNSSANSWADITNFNVSITPTASDKKILILSDINGVADTFHGLFSMKIQRKIGSGSYADLAAILTDVSASGWSSPTSDSTYGNLRGWYDTNDSVNTHLHYLDSPNTTDAVSYKWQVWATNGTVRFNTTVNNNSSFQGGTRLTLIEI
jgi:hypothetical protein